MPEDLSAVNVDIDLTSAGRTVTDANALPTAVDIDPGEGAGASLTEARAGAAVDAPALAGEDTRPRPRPHSPEPASASPAAAGGGSTDSTDSGEIPASGAGPVDSGAAVPLADTARDEAVALASIPRGDWTVDPDRKRTGLTAGTHRNLSRAVLACLIILFFAPLLWLLFTTLSSVSHVAH